MRGVFDATLEVHVARGDLPRTYTAAMAYSNIVPNAFIKAMRDSTFAHIDAIGPIRWAFGPLGWGTDGATVSTFGWRFTITGIKMRETVT